jgi:hypothetical protein
MWHWPRSDGVELAVLFSAPHGYPFAISPAHRHVTEARSGWNLLERCCFDAGALLAS